MLSKSTVIGLLLSLACVCIWASGTEATTMYFYVADDDDANGYVFTHRDTSWDDARGDTEGDFADCNERLQVGFENRYDVWTIERSFLHFDTSDLPQNANITSAELRLRLWMTASQYGDADSLYVLGGTQSSYINVKDYNNFVGWHSGSGAYNGPIVGRIA